jgi:hypothetical protein
MKDGYSKNTDERYQEGKHGTVTLKVEFITSTSTNEPSDICDECRKEFIKWYIKNF